MVCGNQAVNDVALTFDMETVRPVQPVWRDGVYSCQFVYAHGATASVSEKELPTVATATAYFNDLAKRLGKARAVRNVLGGGDAFVTANGSFVVRDRSKVLVVDANGLRPDFEHGRDAQTLATILLSEWHPM